MKLTFQGYAIILHFIPWKGEHRDLGTDTDAMVAYVKHDIQRAICLRPKAETVVESAPEPVG